MKTKLDELLSSYLKNDKKAFEALSKNKITSENIYHIEVAQRAKLVRDSRIFKSSRLKVWNIPSQKEKASSVQKKEFAYPDFLEFALKDEERRKISRGKINSETKTTDLIKEQNKLGETKAMNKSIWVFKSKPERKKAILEILSKYKELTLLDLCRRHGEEIGVKWPESGKWNENPWKAIRSDCRDLEKEKKILVTKGRDRKVVVKLITDKAAAPETAAMAETKKIEISPPSISKPSISTAATNVPSFTELTKEIRKLNDEVDKLTDEILEIWKTLAKLKIQ